MRPHGVVVAAPFFQRQARVHERGEQRLVQELVAQAAIETLDEGVLNRLARIDVVPIDMGLGRPGHDGVAGQFRAVVADASSSQLLDAGNWVFEFLNHISF